MPAEEASGEGQVGGHGDMIVENAEVWKAFAKTEDRRGERELDFLRSVSERSDLPVLQEFVPRFVKEAERDGKLFIVMNNALEGFAAPALMDIKIGRETWEPDATPEKKAKMIAKAKQSTCWELGFRLTGGKFRTSTDGAWEKFGKAGGVKVDSREEIENVFSRFFWHPKLRERACERISVLKSWFEAQGDFAFIGTSLLFSYDTAVEEPELRLNMIDFQHVQCFKSVDLERRDENCLMGLRILSDMLHSLSPSLDQSNAFARMKVLFRQLDRDGTGKVSRAEFEAVLQRACGWSGDKMLQLTSVAAGIQGEKVVLDDFFEWIFNTSRST